MIPIDLTSGGCHFTGPPADFVVLSPSFNGRAKPKSATINHNQYTSTTINFKQHSTAIYLLEHAVFESTICCEQPNLDEQRHAHANESIRQ
jgi:hypothetical protein